jgi:hypothetical protein
MEKALNQAALPLSRGLRGSRCQEGLAFLIFRALLSTDELIIIAVNVSLTPHVSAMKLHHANAVSLQLAPASRLTRWAQQPGGLLMPHGSQWTLAPLQT